MLFELVYMSRAQSPMVERDLTALLVEARANNERVGITGMLLYRNGSFLQLLEGEEQQVLKLYDTVRQDPRHGRVTQLYSHHLPQRHFADWSMGFVNADRVDEEQLPGLSDIMSDRFDASALQQMKAASVEILLYFKDQA
ncbi:BLUF domain-containing protein [Shewanella corallii]|uniref:BLUF domain-containing protein n=1 Tax=Shewanella corallii TaxID=560080 RepID=A0ABT0NB86_9GAMM|nr:BLUF domain-containing protein [Shewanella corallii]MCL2915728.1 BLUF domain-containing protein [Shewanella corallii]